MSDQEFNDLRKTFPWTAHNSITAVGGLVRIIDCNGSEVPIFTMTAFLEVMTKKLMIKTEA